MASFILKLIICALAVFTIYDMVERHWWETFTDLLMLGSLIGILWSATELVKMHKQKPE